MSSDPDFRTTGYRSHTFNGKGKPAGHTRKGREFAQRLIESENYRKWIFDRIQTRSLDPSIERLLWNYAYGKPKEYIEITSKQHELSEASSDMLADRAKQLATLLSQLSAATTRAEADRLIAALASLENEASPTIQ